MARIRYAGQPSRPIRSLPLHRHEVWIVIVYTYGKGTIRFERETHGFQRGTVLCVPPRMPYAEKSAWGFKSAFIAVAEIALDPSRPHRLDGSGLALELAPLLVDVFNRKGARSALLAEQLFDTLLLSLVTAREDPAHPLVKRLASLIHQHWADPDFHVGKALQELPISPAHLRRVFARELKMPPVTYLLKHRVQQALGLLSIGDYSVKEVSQRCGFSDPYYFSRAFRKINGLAPSQWSAFGPDR